MVEYSGIMPKPADLYATLIELLADQEGCRISYTVSDDTGYIRTNKEKRHESN